MNWHWLRHDWGEWEVAEATYTGLLVVYGLASAKRDVQARKCKTCGLVRIKEFS